MFWFVAHDKELLGLSNPVVKAHKINPLPARAEQLADHLSLVFGRDLAFASVSEVCRRSWTLDFDETFISSSIGISDWTITGLAIAYTEEDATEASLLVLREGEASSSEGNGQVLQYGTDNAGDPVVLLIPAINSWSFSWLKDVEYDCTNQRILLADVPLNSDIVMSFFEISSAS